VPEEKFEPSMLAGELRELNTSLGIPDRLTAVGVKEEKIGEMARDAMKSGNIAVNPRTTTLEDVIGLYKKLL
jgi:alcohol dehydrogenase